MKVLQPATHTCLLTLWYPKFWENIKENECNTGYGRNRKRERRKKEEEKGKTEPHRSQVEYALLAKSYKANWKRNMETCFLLLK